MASIVTQSGQNGPKWVQNGPKRVPKGGPKGGGPKMGPPEVGTKKKSKNIFSLALLWGVIGPPSKNTVLGRLHQSTPRIRPILEKSAGFPPGGWPSGGDFRTFFSKIGEYEGWIGVTFLKNWSKRGVPLFWTLFGDFGDFR